MSQASHHDHVSCIRIVPIFNHLPDDIMDKIGEKAQRKEYKRGEFLYHAGDMDQRVYIINQGQVRIYRLSETGKEQIIRVLNPGDFTGEWAIFNASGTHDEYAEVTRKTTVCTFHRDDLLEIIQENPEVSMHLMSEMSNRLKSSERQTAHVAVEQVVDRIIYFLEENADPEQGDAPIIDLPMQKKDVASYLGTTPETLSRKFAELEEKGLIEQLPKGRVKVFDLDDLLLYTE